MTLMNGRKAAVRQLIDKQAIRNVLATHSRGIDRNSFSMLRSAYHDGGKAVYGDFQADADSFSRIITDSMRGQPMSQHRTSNMWITVDGEHAKSESYVIAYVETLDETGSVQRLVGGRYLDMHEKHDGEWGLTQRNYVMDWNSNCPGTSEWPELMGKNFAPRGAHASQDPGLAMLALWNAHLNKPVNTKGTGMKDDIQFNMEIEAALSKQAMQELVMATCRGVDRNDEELLNSAFHDDAVVVSGAFNGVAPEFCAYITKLVRNNMKSTFHSVANQWFDVSGDQGVGESYVIAFSTFDENGTEQESIVGGRYLDRYERRDNVWKIAERVFVMDWNRNAPSSAIYGEGMYASLKVRGGFMPHDPISGFWPGN